MRLLVLSCLVSVIAARPQEIVSEDEVELVPPENTNTDDGGDIGGGDGEDPVIFILRIPNFGGNDEDSGESDGGFPGFGGGFPGFGGNDRPFSGFPSIFGGRPRVPQIPQNPFDILDDIFPGPPSSPRDDAVTDEEVELVDPVEVDNGMPVSNGGGGDGCGLLCLMFGIVHKLQDEIDVLNTEVHGNGGFPFNGGFPALPAVGGDNADVNNSTSEIEILEDGTTIMTNRTVYRDTDENGNTIFIQTTITTHHDDNNSNNNNNNAGSIPALPLPDDDYESVVPDESQYDVDLNAEDAGFEDGDELPVEDPAENEIPGVDGGLTE